VWGAPRSDRQGGGRGECASAAGQEGLTARRRGANGADVSQTSAGPQEAR
jgi:hypothetical protein